MEQIDSRENLKRMIEADRLYRTGLTLQETGRGMVPPITGVRVGQLLARGVELGLFVHLRAERKSGANLTAAAVRKAARSCAGRGQVAGRLGVDQAALEERFGSVIDDEFASRRAARKTMARARVAADIDLLGAKLGRYPSWVDLGRNLKQRVKKQFGSFDAFLAAQSPADADAASIRLATIRARVVADYLILASNLGRNPTSADIGSRTGLFRRVFKYFGTFEAFLAAAHVRPDYVKRTCRERAFAALEMAPNRIGEIEPDFAAIGAEVIHPVSSAVPGLRDPLCEI